MEAGNLLRLAWEAEHDGRSRLRDSLLTLAVAESVPGEAWAERCRTRLVQDRPDHFYAHFSTINKAVSDQRVIEALDRIRIKYPPARVQSLLLRARAARGPYLGRVESLEAMVEDLAGPSAEAENVRRDAPQPSRGPLNRHRVARPLAWSLAYPSMNSGLEGSRDSDLPEAPLDWEEPEVEGPSQEFSVYYLTVLLAIAILLATVQQSTEGPRR